MSVESTLKRVEADLACGDLGKARDRMHGLIASYPYDMLLRRKLGDIYWKLQYPAMAGRYWYLEQENSAEMVAACESFERACGTNPVIMLNALRFRGDIDRIRDTRAGQLLLRLQSRAKKECDVAYRFGERGRRRYGTPARAAVRWTGCLLLIGITLGLIGVLVVIGVATVAGWIVNMAS